MVEDLGYGGSQLGYYAGGLAASFCGAQFCSSILWGMFSDKYGRKPAIALGTLGAAVGMLVFGSATNYTYALVGRIFSGLLSGNLGVLKCFLTEITDESNRGAGFSYMSVAWALGTIIAPLAGGLLCKPADKYPRYFKKSGIFGVYPYLLPCVICVVVNVVSACMCQLYMVETRNRKGQPAMSNAEAKHGNCCRLCPSLGMPTEKQDKIDVAKFEMESSSQSHSSGSAFSGGFIKRKFTNLVEGFESTKSSIMRSLNIGGAVSHSNIRYDAVKPDCSAEEMNTTIMECDDDIDDGNFESHSLVKKADVRSEDEVELSIMETGQSSTDHNTSKTPASTGSANEFKLTSLSDCDTSDEEMDSNVDKNEEDEEEEAEEELCFCCRNTSTTRCVEEATPIKYDSSSSLSGALLPSDDGFGELFTVESTNSSTDDWQSDATRDLKTIQKKNVKKSLQKQNVLKTRSVVLVTCNYGLLAMAFILWEETIPLFLKLNTSQGGFGLLSSDIGLLLSSSGGVMLVFTYLALPSLARRSKKWLFRLGICSAIPITFAIPVLATAKAMNPEIFQTKQGHFLLWMLLILCCVLKNISACISFTA
jgi:Major Facilitator Superfamily